MNVGFTGTQRGMNPAQEHKLAELLPLVNKGGEFHHGLCKGADDQASRIARNAKWLVVGHPGHDAHGNGERHGYATRVTEPHPYLVRNHHIVDACQLLIAAPRGAEVLRSGTWATVRYARKRGKPVIIINRDGTTS